jgi:hypothetical protein
MSLWLWDYLLFSNMNKRFQLYVGKSAVRGFEYFSKLLYVAANKKSSPLKATENEITNAFEHSDYIRMSATTMISGCFNCSWFYV